MAKLTANGCHEIGKVTLKRSTGRYVFALRSDGKVLVRNAGFYNLNGSYTPHPTDYTIHASMKLPEGKTAYDADDVRRMEMILVRKGYEVVS